jgi:hypothetical protein
LSIVAVARTAFTVVSGSGTSSAECGGCYNRWYLLLTDIEDLKNALKRLFGERAQSEPDDNNHSYVHRRY